MSKKRIFLPWGGVLDVFHCRTHITLCSCFPLPDSSVEQHCSVAQWVGTTGPERLRASFAGCFAVGSQILFLMLNLPPAPFLLLLFSS